MVTPNRLRYKIFTSFAFAVLGGVAAVRLATVAPFSTSTMLAYGVAGIFVAAGVWRGLIYLRAMRAMARS
jgi:hypothetical protein